MLNGYLLQLDNLSYMYRRNIFLFVYAITIAHHVGFA